jgi:geranylgeranyl diphosphate synthase type 3
MSQVILEPFEYLMANPGKDFRSKLIKSFDVWIHISTEKRDIIKDVINMLHNSSLLYFGLLSRIDDVEDQSELRRGSPVAHKIFGIPKTINSANYVYFLALQKTLELQSPVAIEVFTHELLQLHIGQGLEIHWRDSVQCPNVEEYINMVSNSSRTIDHRN